ncbi:MAG: hypothetical protein V1676_06070 [Candidatus Diapherotrites archaeon]
MICLKNAIFAFLVLVLFCGAVSATEIISAKQVPADMLWGFSVLMPATDTFDSTKIFLDGTEIAAVYSSSQFVLTPSANGVVAVYLYDKDPKSNSGLTFAVSHAGLGEGVHTIRAESYNEGGTLDSAEAQPSFFVPEDLLSNRLNEAEATLEEIKTKQAGMKIDDEQIYSELKVAQSDLKALADRAAALEQETQAYGQETGNSSAAMAEISMLNSDLRAVQDRLDALGAQFTELEKPEPSLLESIFGSGSSAQQASETGDAAGQEGEEQGSLFAGLLSLGSGGILPIALAVFIVAAVIAVFAYYKYKSSSSDFGYGGDPFGSDSIFDNIGLGAKKLEQKRQGKWPSNNPSQDSGEEE